MVTETIAVETQLDYVALAKALDYERLTYSVRFDEDEPMPYEAVVYGQPGHIQQVLRRLDEFGIRYETTAPLPTVGDY